MNEKYMNEALKEAKKALLKDDVPVGCVIVKNDKIVAKAHNKKEKTSEMSFISLVVQKFGKLTVLERVENNRFNHVCWKC